MLSCSIFVFQEYHQNENICMIWYAVMRPRYLYIEFYSILAITLTKILQNKNEHNSFNFHSIILMIIGIASIFLIRFTSPFGFFLRRMLIERRSSEFSALNSPFPFSSFEEMVSRDNTTKNYYIKKLRDLLPGSARRRRAR